MTGLLADLYSAEPGAGDRVQARLASAQACIDALTKHSKTVDCEAEAATATSSVEGKQWPLIQQIEWKQDVRASGSTVADSLRRAMANSFPQLFLDHHLRRNTSQQRKRDRGEEAGAQKAAPARQQWAKGAIEIPPPQKKGRSDVLAAVDQCITMMEKQVPGVSFAKVYTTCDDSGTEVLSELRCQFPLLFYVSVAFVVSSRDKNEEGVSSSEDYMHQPKPVKVSVVGVDERDQASFMRDIHEGDNSGLQHRSSAWKPSTHALFRKISEHAAEALLFYSMGGGKGGASESGSISGPLSGLFAWLAHYQDLHRAPCAGTCAEAGLVLLSGAAPAEAHLKYDPDSASLLPPSFREPGTGAAYHAEVYLQTHSSLFQ
jgi:hypothetical protein